MASSLDTISVLRGLIHTCREGLDGYRAAAERVDDAGLRSLFERYAAQRAAFLGELEGEVLRLGEDPAEMRTLPEALEKGWTNLRAAIGSSDRDAIVAGCEQGEDEAVESYRAALAAPLPDPIHEIVERQYNDVLRAHDELRALERGG